MTLDQLDEAVAPLGLVYPVYPGETSASLGGNVATNAGGMRAVKYGVTRHQVLGLEAVLATGEVIRTGGKFVKATTGYDLTQLIIGSEGTLAVVTEAIAEDVPASRDTRRPCSRRSHARRGVGRGAAHREQRREPAGPRVHRRVEHGRDHRERRARPRHPGARSRPRRGVSRRRDRAAPRAIALEEDTVAVAELLAELGAHRRVRLAAALRARCCSKHARRRSGS